MRLCGLLMILSLVLAEEYDNDATCDICNEDGHTVVLTKSHQTSMFTGSLDVKCIIYNYNRLRCNWSTDSVPEDAQYSASFQHCDVEDEEDPKHHPLNCTKKLAECQGFIQSDYDIVVKVNISTNFDWYVICQQYTTVKIEKLDPPQNISTSVVSENLRMQWSLPKSHFFTQRKCFQYELKINDETINFRENLEYNKTNFDPTKKYIIQMRTKPTTCASNDNWSEWSEAVVVDPSGNMNPLSASVIVSIAFVLPMILLALLLICKFQRLFDKLFPSIPNPSKNVQQLLEKNEFNQVTPPKKSEEADEVFEVVEYRASLARYFE